MNVSDIKTYPDHRGKRELLKHMDGRASSSFQKLRKILLIAVILSAFCVCFGRIVIADEAVKEALRHGELKESPTKARLLHIIHKVSVVKTAIIPQGNTPINICPLLGGWFYKISKPRHPVICLLRDYRVGSDSGGIGIYWCDGQFVNDLPSGVQSLWKRRCSPVVNEFESFDCKKLTTDALCGSTRSRRNNGRIEYADNGRFNSYDSIGATVSSVSSLSGRKPKEDIKDCKYSGDEGNKTGDKNAPPLIRRFCLALISFVIGLFFGGWAGSLDDKRKFLRATLLVVAIFVTVSGVFLLTVAAFSWSWGWPV